MQEKIVDDQKDNTLKMYKFDLGDEIPYSYDETNGFLDDNGSEPDGNVNLLPVDEMPYPCDAEIVDVSIIDWENPEEVDIIDGKEWM